MEMIDVLNEDGTSTGLAVTKEEIHEKGFWHRIIHVWVINPSKEVLVQLKAPRITGNSGVYDISVAGHLSTGETSVQGAVREFEEELGVKIKEENLIKIGEVKQEGYRTLKTANKEWNDIFIYRTNLKAGEFVPNPEEVESVKYVSIQELKDWFNDTKIIHPQEVELLLGCLN